MTEYDARLRELAGQLSRLHKTGAMLGELHRQLESKEAEQHALAAALAKEQADVDRLERVSLASIFADLTNRRDEQLNKERAEAYAAALKYNSAVRQAQAIAESITSLERERAALQGAQAEYDALFARKAEAVRSSDPVNGPALCDLEQKLGALLAQHKELQEALQAGDRVLGCLAGIEEELNSAEGWGTWDLLGGGMLSDIAKHSHLDEAQQRLAELQELLRCYRTELADVTIEADMQVEIDGFLRFADYFFDGLFADWAVLDRIHSSQRQIADTHAQVNAVQARLDSMDRAAGAEYERLSQQRAALVTEA